MVRDRVVEQAYAAGWATVQKMPEWVARRQFDAIADAAFVRGGRSVRRLTANLRRVLGPEVSDRELRRVAHQGMRSYLRYWCETFRLPVLSRDDVLERFGLDDDEILWGAIRRGKGAVAVLPHQGNWDLAGAWFVARGQAFTTVAERLQPEGLFDRFVAFRESLGMEVIPLSGGERTPFEVLRERLLAGGVVCLLGDRDLTSTGIDVRFFGSTARMPAGPAALAVDTGAALVPVTLYYPDTRRARGRIHPEVPDPGTGSRAERIRVMTQGVAAAFEEGIAAHPQDWHMLQRVWVGDLDASRLHAGDEVTV